MTLYYDTRERSDLPTLIIKKSNDKGIPTQQQHLLVGDYVFGETCIEAKSVSDFLNSVTDGRLYRQADNMDANYRRNIVVLWGGIRQHMATRIRAGLKAMSYGYWQSRITNGIARLMTEYDVAVLWMPDSSAAADVIVGLYVKETTPVKAPESVQPKRIYSDLRLGPLIAIPGISQGLAQRLISHFTTLKGVASASVKDLSQVTGIGKKKAQMIRKVMIDEQKVVF